MKPPIDPTEHTVSDLEEVLQDVNDPETLDAILEAERAGDDRTTAREAIENRLTAVESAITEERAAIQPLDVDDDEVLTLAGPDEDRELSERLLNNLAGIKGSLEEASRSGGQFEARLRKLENEVGELTAYSEALKAFLDEDGTAQQVLDSVQDDLAALEESMDDVKPVVRSHAKTLRDHRRAINDLEDELASQNTDMTEVADDVDSLAARFQNFRDEVAETHEENDKRVENLGEELDDQTEQLETIAGDVDSIEKAVDGVAEEVRALDESAEDRFAAAADERDDLGDRVDTNADSIEDLTTEFDQLATEVDDLTARLGETDHVDDRFQQLEEEIEGIRQWRDQLGSVLGGGGAATHGESED